MRPIQLTEFLDPLDSSCITFVHTQCTYLTLDLIHMSGATRHKTNLELFSKDLVPIRGHMGRLA
jgi:hypothetical protein